MVETTAAERTDTHASATRELLALGELADMLRQLGAEAADAPADIARYLNGLNAVARRIRRMAALDARGREAAARHYYAGVIAGACGDDSAIARGVSDDLARQARHADRAVLRCFISVARIGRRHGRTFAAQCGARMFA
jgi:hypothetical protein